MEQDQFIKEVVKKVLYDLRLEERGATLQIEIAYLMNKDFGGYCTPFTGANYYKVVLNREPCVIDIVNSVAHELRHIWQDIHKKHKEYEHVNVNANDYTQRQFDRYYNQPHEKDARNYATKFVNDIFEE